MKKAYWHSEEYDLLLVVFQKNIMKYILMTREVRSIALTTIDADNFKKVSREKAIEILSEYDFI